MIKIRILTSLLSVFLLVGCNNSGKRSSEISSDSANSASSEEKISIPALPPLEPGTIDVTDKAFGEMISLTGEPVNLPQKIRPVQLFVKNNYLVTCNQRKDSLFMIFRLPEMECVAAFGTSGRGPDEFQYPPGIVETDEDSILFYIYELNNDKLYKVSQSKMEPLYHLTFPKQERSFGDKQPVMITASKAYYSMSTARGKSIFSFNADSLSPETMFNDLAIPGLKGSWTTYIGDFGVNTFHNRMAYAYKYFKRLKIIDMNTKSERSIIFKAEKLAEGQSDIVNLEPTNITHFWGMSPNRDFFWMLYSGRTPVDVQRANRSGNKFIFVEKYDWNGNPVKRFKLDDWGYFCVTPDNTALYLASTAGIHSLLKYDLSGE
jgi:hypothetical protein